MDPDPSAGQVEGCYTGVMSTPVSRWVSHLRKGALGVGISCGRTECVQLRSDRKTDPTSIAVQGLIELLQDIARAVVVTKPRLSVRQELRAAG